MKEPSGKFVVFKDGMPIADYANPYTKQSLPTLFLAALALEYKPKELRSENEFEGITCAEAMVKRRVYAAADGDGEAFTHIMDRILGKPKQQIEQQTIALTYTDVLDEIARREAIEQQNVPQISVNVVTWEDLGI